MDENISMVRFLMFMILSLVIFFNLAPLVLTADEDSDEDSDNGGQGHDNGVASGSKYCLVDGKSHAEKKCKKLSVGETCQNSFLSKEECNDWKDALEYDTFLNEDGSLNYMYAVDDIDKKTIMTSDDMIFCLKSDNECKKIEYGKCTDKKAYISKENCKSAAENQAYESAEGNCGVGYCLYKDNISDGCIQLNSCNKNCGGFFYKDEDECDQRKEEELNKEE